MSRITKRHRKTEVPMVPACPLLTMPPCSGPLLGKRHVSCCRGLQSLPGQWEGSSWPRAKPSAAEITAWPGESPCLLCRHQPWRASPTLPPAHPHPQCWTSELPCTCVARHPSWVRTSLHAEGATALLQVLGPREADVPLCLASRVATGTCSS